MLMLRRFRLLYSAAPKIPHLSRGQHGFIDNSMVPTLFYQDSMPRMPIPELDITLSRYLTNNLKPVVSEEEFIEAKKAVEIFQQVSQQYTHVLSLHRLKKKCLWKNGLSTMFLRPGRRAVAIQKA